MSFLLALGVILRCKDLWTLWKWAAWLSLEAPFRTVAGPVMCFVLLRRYRNGKYFMPSRKTLYTRTQVMKHLIGTMTRKRTFLKWRFAVHSVAAIRSATSINNINTEHRAISLWELSVEFCGVHLGVERSLRVARCSSALSIMQPAMASSPLAVHSGCDAVHARC